MSEDRKLCVVCSTLYSAELRTCPQDGSILVIDSGVGGSGLKLGHVLGNYRLLRLLGEGGAGTVFEAEHVRLGRKMAVKVLHRDSANAAIVTRFFNEARAVNAIKHPNIIDIEDFITTPEGDHYLLMELLSGQDLRTAISSLGKLAPERVSAIGEQVGSALAAVHRVGIIHRDLKPDNIFLVQRDGKEVAKLLDFGIAKFMDQQGVTKAGMTVGTPSYMAPEQITKGTEVGTTSDIYSLGMVLYEALTGSPAFNGSSTASILRGHCLEPVESPSKRRGERVPAVLEAAVLKCLEKEPDKRFATGDALVSALRSDRPVARSKWKPPTRRASQRAVVMMPAFAMFAAAILVQLWPRSGEQVAAATPSVTTPPPRPAPTPPHEPPPAPSAITVALKSDPAGAEMFVGSEPVGRAPVSVEIPRSSEPVSLKARFPDGKETVATIVPDRPRAELVFAKAAVRPATPTKVATKRPKLPTKRVAKPKPAATNRDGMLDPFKR